LSTLREAAERDVFAAQDALDQLRTDLRRESDESRRRVLKLRIEAAHGEHQRCLRALFFVDKHY
jgi:hypothetical protein